MSSAHNFFIYTEIIIIVSVAIEQNVFSTSMCSVRNLFTESVKFLEACKYFFTAASLKPWGDPKELKGGYALEMFFHDTTYYLPIPLRFLRSVEISGKSGAAGKAPFEAVPPCCCGCCELFAVWDCILFYLHLSRARI